MSPALESQLRDRVQPVVVPPSFIKSTSAEEFEKQYDRGNCNWHTLFSSPTTPTDSLCCGIAYCPPSTANSPPGELRRHRHAQAEIYHVTEGKGVVFIEGNEYDVEAGSSVFIPGNSEHGMKSRDGEGVRWFYAFPGAAFGDVVYRFSHEEGERQKTDEVVKAKL